MTGSLDLWTFGPKTKILRFYQVTEKILAKVHFGPLNILAQKILWLGAYVGPETLVKNNFSRETTLTQQTSADNT